MNNINPLLKSKYHVLGVMSGTSLDGIDLAELFLSCSEEGVWDFSFGALETVPYSEGWRNQLNTSIALNSAQIEEFNTKYTQHLGAVILKFISENNITQLDAVCSHGHTVFHQPDRGYTLQIGNLPELANLVRERLVCDFRVQDVALGGQGAPLVPVGDRLLFGSYDYCLNLGGFANISSEINGERIAYDICPVNIILNPVAQAMGLAYDDKGTVAATGKIHQGMLEELNALDFYRAKPPKSLGKEWVDTHVEAIVEQYELSTKDLLRTFTEHITTQLANEISSGASVLVTGGGAYNDFLIGILRSKLAPSVNLVIPSEEIIEYKEALVFGLLGVLKLRNEVNCLSSVTHAREDHSSGYIYMP